MDSVVHNLFVVYFSSFCQGPDADLHSAVLKVAMSHATSEVCLLKAVETLIHRQPKVTDIVFFILWNISFLLVLGLDSKGIINMLKRC